MKFVLKPEDLLLVNEAGQYYAPTGKLAVSVGAGQPVKSIAGEPNVIQKTIAVQ